MPQKNRLMGILILLALATVLSAAPALKHIRSETGDFPAIVSHLMLSGAQGDSLQLTSKGLSIKMDGKLASGISVKPYSDGGKGSNILLCIDASGSMSKAQFATIRGALNATIQSLPAGTNIAIALFANEFEAVTDFSPDKVKLQEAIKSIGTRPGNTYLHFSLEKAIKYITERNLNGYNSIVLISDGKEEVKFDVMTDNDIAAMLKLAGDNGIPIHTIGYSKDKNPDYNLLDYVSTRSGGTFYHLQEQGQLAGFVGDLLGASGKLYAVSYKACGVKGDGKAHPVVFSFRSGADSLSAATELSIPNNGKICSGSGAGSLLKKYLIPIIVLGVAILALVLYLLLRKKRNTAGAEPDPLPEIPPEEPSLLSGTEEPASVDFGETAESLPEADATRETPASEGPSMADWRDRTVILGPDGKPVLPLAEAEAEAVQLPPEPEKEEIDQFTLLKIDILAGPDAGKVYAVDISGITIGRGTGNGIVVSDPQTSRQHARIYYQDYQFHIQDLQSRNGTVVNSVPITDHVIRHNDTFLIGSNAGNFYLA